MDGEFPSNSKEPVRRTQQSKKVERVTQSDVVVRKKGIFKQFSNTFFSGDSLQDVVRDVIMDVLIPSAKDTIADAFSQGLERKLFGQARSRSRRTGNGPNTGFINYRGISSNKNDPRDRDRDLSRRARASHNFDEIIIPTRVEAEEVIDQLFQLVSQYEMATVADLYALVGLQSDHTDEKWGWTDLRGAGVQRITHGYLLDIPQPEPIK